MPKYRRREKEKLGPETKKALAIPLKNHVSKIREICVSTPDLADVSDEKILDLLYLLIEAGSIEIDFNGEVDESFPMKFCRLLHIFAI